MKAIPPEVNFSKLENEILEFWQNECIFDKSNLSHQKTFSFYDGPPFANGLPHYGHLLANTIKDTVPRYWNMRGYSVDRRFGWDCHGFPVESEIEKNNNLKGRNDILEFGVAKFNEECRASVLNYADEWQKTITRLGRWVDWKRQYKTMDKDFMESVWWVFKNLYDQGLIYKSHKVVAYSPRNATVVSNFEANQNYKDIQDPAVTVKFKLVDEDAYFLAWTTTPWTLIANLSLAVHAKAEYSKIKLTESNEIFYLASSRIEAVINEPYEVVKTFNGEYLKNKSYEPLFPYYKSQANAFKILCDDYVTTNDGTGIVHQAPAFGEDDFRVCQANGIDIVDPLDLDGYYLPEIKPYAGQFVKDADKNIIKDLKNQNKIYRHDTIVHSYPFCDRTDTPLIYRAIPSWYVKVEAIKDRLVKNNQTINWVPDHLRDGRMGKWLENAKDWSISRNRFWGTPLPVWQCNKNESHILVLGSIEELETLTKSKIDDLHKHKIDHLEFNCHICKDNQTKMQRIPEVFDCWFESGSMPYAQIHFPFENKEVFSKYFPGDFIAEGLDQTRGWFYTLSVLSSALYDKPAFKNVIVNGIICDETGRKMSKRHKNYTPPNELLETYGADSVRVYMLNSAVLKGENLIFNPNGVKDTTRSVLLPLWNAHSFLTTYAQADNWKPNKELALGAPPKLIGETDPLDLWLLSRLQTLTANFHKLMESYQLYAVIPQVLTFIDELTNWYIRLSRKRFWSDSTSGISQDSQNAYSTLYFALIEFSKLFAPFAPFVCERIYKNLTSELADVKESVHLCVMPECKTKLIDSKLEKQMLVAQITTELGRSLRSKHQIKTRQPLKKGVVITQSELDMVAAKQSAELIKSELNLKEIDFSQNETQLVDYVIKPNLKILGKKLGPQLKSLQNKLQEINQNTDLSLEVINNARSTPNAIKIGDFILDTNELLIERTPKSGLTVASQDGLTILLDIELNSELIEEGLARELVNRIQNFRKECNLKVSDRIQIELQLPTEFETAAKNNNDYIANQTLATKIDFTSSSSNRFNFLGDFEIESQPCKIGLNVV